MTFCIHPLRRVGGNRWIVPVTFAASESDQRTFFVPVKWSRRNRCVVPVGPLSEELLELGIDQFVGDLVDPDMLSAAEEGGWKWPTA